MAARRAVIQKWTAKDIDADPARLGLNGSPTRVVKTFVPIQRLNGEMIDGEPAEMVARLVDKLRDTIIEASA
jgi:electron transfer flavoprotein beta subunit